MQPNATLYPIPSPPATSLPEPDPGSSTHNTQSTLHHAGTKPAHESIHPSPRQRRRPPRQSAPRRQTSPRQGRQAPVPPARPCPQRPEAQLRPHRLQPAQALQQTAQLVGTETGYEHADPHLRRARPRRHLRPVPAPAARVRRLRKRARRRPQSQHHRSSSAHLLGVGPNDGPDAPRHQPRIRLRKGSLARVNLHRGPATLQWLLDPRTVRALYATSTKSSRRKTSRK